MDDFDICTWVGNSNYWPLDTMALYQDDIVFKPYSNFRDVKIWEVMKISEPIKYGTLNWVGDL